MTQLDTLYALQQTDTEIHDKKQQLGEVLRAQKETSEIIAARERVESLGVSVHKARAIHKDLALELGSVNDKARTSEKRLYSGDIKNTKELADLQHEIEALGRRRDVLETEVLEALMAAESLEADLQEAQTTLANMTAAWESSVESLKVEQQTLAIGLFKLGQLRDQRAAKVPAALLKTYDRLSQQKGGVAVAVARGGKCLACQVTIPADRLRDAEKGNLVYCDSCGRILVVR